MKLNSIAITVTCIAGLLMTGLLPVTAETTRDTVPLEDAVVSTDLGPDTVRTLRESGDILSLESVLEKVRQEYPGRIIEIELEDEDGRMIYELEVVDDDGIVNEIEVDATTGDILKTGRDT